MDGLNRYAYARNNPVRYDDPTGHCVNFFGIEYKCSPEFAIRILDCSISISACGEVFDAQGVTTDPKLVRMAHEFSVWAVGRLQFWANFFHQDFYPYSRANRGKLGPYPDPTRAEHLLQMGAPVSPKLTSEISTPPPRSSARFAV